MYKIKKNIRSIKGFQEFWCTSDGGARLKHISATDYPKDAAHKVAFDKQLHSQGLNPRDCKEKEQHLLAQAGQQSIIQHVDNVNKKDLAET